jgi:hypothetical protein
LDTSPPDGDVTVTVTCADAVPTAVTGNVDDWANTPAADKAKITPVHAHCRFRHVEIFASPETRCGFTGSSDVAGACAAQGVCWLVI